ncbi:hypothetical protein [Algoriphagus sp. NG3]|uniref:hypothetical protein n=1 Tax=Algoriphagus sp. NG3 TaxID=3097546 RepID=UPI002A823681|nr:hypothetical protein [Algoriphagus sp. NG3]WPR73559.1 hypothetical protein SLW71_12810 [Algoriphagus sp. NG3]
MSIKFPESFILCGIRRSIHRMIAVLQLSFEKQFRLIMHSAQKKPIPEIDSEVEIKEVMEMIKYIMIDGDFIPRVRANGCFLATLKMYLWTGNSILP